MSRVDIENALKDDELLSTDFMLFLKEKYTSEKSIQKNTSRPCRALSMNSFAPAQSGRSPSS